MNIYIADFASLLHACSVSNMSSSISIKQMYNICHAVMHIDCNDHGGLMNELQLMVVENWGSVSEYHKVIILIALVAGTTSASSKIIVEWLADLITSTADDNSMHIKITQQTIEAVLSREDLASSEHGFKRSVRVIASVC